MMALAGSRKAPMTSKRIEAGDLSLVHWPTVENEVAGLARYVKAKKDTEFLILVPRRFIGYRLKEKIGADAQTSFHEEVLEEQVVQERLAMISLFSNPGDRVALRAVLGFHSNGIQYGPKRNAEAYRSIRAASLGTIEILKGIAQGEIEISGEGSRHLKVRARSALEFFERFANNPNLELVIKATFNPELAAAISDPEDREKAKQDLEQLLDAAMTLLGQSESPDLSKILDHLRYRIAMRIPLGEALKTRVRILTLHGAKGLEAENVIVAGVADQIIPGIGRYNPEEAEQAREEQRRLLYVSVTRAKRELVISWPQVIKYKDATKNNVRIDPGSVFRFRGSEDQVVRLGKTTLLPDSHNI
jgi:superfamily I DNA/RNA helicase